jgi:hypothetical protein
VTTLVAQLDGGAGVMDAGLFDLGGQSVVAVGGATALFPCPGVASWIIGPVHPVSGGCSFAV